MWSLVQTVSKCSLKKSGSSASMADNLQSSRSGDYFTPLCLIFNNARDRAIDWFLDSTEKRLRET